MFYRDRAVPHAHSAAAREIFDLLTLSFVVCGVIFAIVAGAVAWCVFRYRRRHRDADEPVQNHGNRRLEITWTVVPLLLLVGLFSLTARAMRRADAAPSGSPDLVVRGHQWWWEARYLDHASPSGEPVVTANEIHIPVGQALLLRIEGADVIHDFWVPALARKVDAVPGHPNNLWLEADTAGVYPGACAEYCGTQHARMRFQVIAESPADYRTWLAAQRRPAEAPATASAARGAKLFRAKTCVGCHVVRGVEGDLGTSVAALDLKNRAAPLAPDLTHLASRRLLAGGSAADTPQELARWLKNPAAIKPGARMPNLGLSDADVADLVSYLGSLR